MMNNKPATSLSAHVLNNSEYTENAMLTNTQNQTQLSVIDLFGNVLQVTDLNAAIAERKMCVNAGVEFNTEPFKYEQGIKVTIPERAGEKVMMASYHHDLLEKLLELQAQQVS